MSRKRHKQKARQPTSGAAITRKVKNTGYSTAGASYQKGSMAAWRPTRSSPQSDIDVNLNTLRARSSDLVVGAPIASSAINANRTNIIGSGLMLSPKPKYKMLGITAAEAETWGRKTKEDFDLWASSKFCDIHRKNNWYDMQDIAYVTYLIDGDSFALLKYREPAPGMPYALRLQLVEASRVCNPGVQSLVGTISPWMVTMRNPQNGNRIVNGVEIDEDGAVMAYWVCNRYPFDPTNMEQLPEWQRVTAFGERTGQPNILQICHDERPEQYRGVPYLAPVLETVKQVSRYTEAELTSAIIKSFFSMFIKETVVGKDFPLAPTAPGGERYDLDPSSFELGPGTVNVLPPGYDITSMDAQRSLSTFEPFTKELVKQIGASLELPYEVLMKAFNSSYTASRAALLQAWATFKTRRAWFSRDFCQPSYEAWLAEAVAIGRIDAPGFFDDPLIRKAWCNAEWYGPVMGVLDPIKEAQGAALRIQYGFSTREKEAAEMTGTDWDENIERLAIEQATMKQHGITFATADVPKSEQAMPEEGGEEK